MLSTRPNVLLLVIDCLRADRVCGTGGEARTPFLDRAREESVLFETVISTNSFTLPCMTTYMTGLYPFHHGLRVQTAGRLDASKRLLMEYLKEVGYTTFMRLGGAFGKENGLDRGADDYEQGHRESAFRDRFGPPLIEALQAGRYPEPWAGYAHIMDVHVPRVIPPEYAESRYGRHEYDRALSALDPWLARTVEAAGPNTVVFITGDHGEGLPKATFARSLDKLWWARRAFWRIGQRLVGHKRWAKIVEPRLRVARRRMVAGAGGSATRKSDDVLGHGWVCYDPQVRVPFVALNLPGAAPRRVPAAVRTVDFLPTVLDLAGHPQAGSLNLDGRSLLPLARGEAEPGRTAYVECTSGQLDDVPLDQWQMGLRTDTRKYIARPFASERQAELYDLEADPAETVNLASERPDETAAMWDTLRGINPEIDAGEIGVAAAEAQTVSAEDEAVIEERLRDLGYLD